MTMKTHKWAAVRGRRAPDVEAAIEATKVEMRAAMRVADIRKAHELTTDVGRDH